MNVPESIRTAANPPASIVHTSTDKIYGDSGGEPYDEELSRLQASGVYDVSKLAADAFARMYHSVYGLPTVVVRLCNIFGPGDFNTGYRIVPKAMKSLLGANVPSPPELYEGSLHHERDFLYIDDCVRALMGVASAPQCYGKVYNLMGCVHVKTPGMIQAVLQAVTHIERRRPTLTGRLKSRRADTSSMPERSQKVVTIPSQRASGPFRLKTDLGL